MSEHHIYFYITHMGVLNFSDYFGLILYFCLLWMGKFFFVSLKRFANIHRLFLPFLASWSPSSSHNIVVLAGEDLSMLHQMISCGWACGYKCCMCWVETLCVCGCERSKGVFGKSVRHCRWVDLEAVFLLLPMKTRAGVLVSLEKLCVVGAAFWSYHHCLHSKADNVVFWRKDYSVRLELGSFFLI